MIEALLAAGADLEARNQGGDTPLYMAVYNPNPAIIEALLAAGADLEALEAERKRAGRPLLNSAVYNPNPAIIELLLAGRRRPDGAG